MTWKRIVPTGLGGPDKLAVQTVESLPQPEKQRAATPLLAIAALLLPMLLAQRIMQLNAGTEFGPEAAAPYDRFLGCVCRSDLVPLPARARNPPRWILDG